MRLLPRCTTIGCSEKSILLFSPYFTTLSVVVRVCIKKPVNKGFSFNFALWNISDASVGTEELAHVEIISTLFYQLTNGLTPQEIKEGGLDAYFTDHTLGVYPTNSAGIPFSADTFQSVGDPISDLTEDMAAEQKARTTYDNILALSKNEDVNKVIRFLREREIVHYQRFAEGLEYVKSQLNKKNYYAYNPSFTSSKREQTCE